ncbi:MAG: methyltransferase domain-containing protein [Pelotomaculum sp.]|jgi:23S rRNA (guanine745-N1)-methyltransferase
MNIKKVKKKDKAAKIIRYNQEIFKCPVCDKNMQLNDSYSLVCSLNHCYDISRNGYINLLTSSKKPVYSKKLFEARHKVCRQGFYEPLIEQLELIIKRHLGSKTGRKEVKIVDAGCGEGSHLCDLHQKIKGDPKFKLIGADISKEGINIAATASNDIIWIVADLTRLPFMNKSIDVILNILSPANYPEFERVLSNDGIVIKVIPNRLYLKELREVFYNNNRYSNNRVMDYFSNKLQVILTRNIRYQFNIEKELLPDLIKMTPLTWGKSVNSKLDLQQIDISEITVDLTILVGRKK